MPDAPTGDPRAGERDNAFDVARFSLATIVVFAHAYYALGERGVHVGLMAVLGFFGISGFLVTQSWLRRRSVADFVARRALRIYPAYAAVCLFDHLVVAPLATGGRHLGRLDVGDVVREIVLLRHLSIPGVFDALPVHAVNASLWSIPYEVLCYALLAALGTLGLLGRRGALLAVTAALWALNLVLPELPRLAGGLRTFAQVLPFVVAFLVGVVACVHRDRPAATPLRVAGVVALLVATLGHKALFRAVWPLGLPYVLLWVARHPRAPLKGWGRRGDFSYGLYLFAFPIQQLLVHVGGRGVHPIALFVAAMVLTLPLAAASWFLVERPFLRLKDRRSPGADEAGVPRRAA